MNDRITTIINDLLTINLLLWPGDQFDDLQTAAIHEQMDNIHTAINTMNYIVETANN